MKYLESKVLTSLFIAPFLLSVALTAQEYEEYQQYQGPGNVQVEVRSYGQNRPNFASERNPSSIASEMNNSVCYAIKHQKRMEMIVETQDIANKKEMKTVTKKFLIEPYAFGMTTDGKPVFSGKVIEEKLDKEVNVTYGEDKFDDQAISSSKKKDKVVSGWFGADKNKDIDIKNIKGIRVIEDSHFDAPKEYGGLSQANVQVICQLPITKESQ